MKARSDYAWQVLADSRRLLRARPLGNLMAVLVLALGLTAVVVVSSLAAMLADPAPDSVPASALYRYGVDAGGGNVFLLPRDEALALRDQPALARTALYRWADFNLSGESQGHDGQAERVSGLLVDGDPFALLDWRMALGRGFSSEDFAAGAAPVVVIGDRLWRNRFGADPLIVGRMLRVDGEPATVVGVLPPHRAYPFQNQVYRAISLASDEVRGSGQWRALSRIEDRAGLAQAEAAVAALQSERERILGDVAVRTPVRIALEWSDAIEPQVQMLIAVLAFVVALVMLLAASNAGGMVLVQWLGRGRDLALRHALGASSARIVASLAGHGVLLVLAAWLLALGLGALLLDSINQYFWSVDNGIPLYASLKLSPGILVLSLGVALLAAGCLTVPTWRRLRRHGLAQDLRNGMRTTASPAGRVGAALFGLQSALAVVTVLATVQAMQGARGALERPLGLDTSQVLVAGFVGGSAERNVRLAAGLRERLAAEPGFRAVSVSATMPVAAVMQTEVIRGEGRAIANHAPVDESFAAVYGLGMRSGRWFSASDVIERRRVAVIDPVLAEALFGATPAVGLSVSRQVGQELVEYQVIGVSERVRMGIHAGVPAGSMFLPQPADWSGGLALAARVQGAPQAFVARVQAVAAEVEPDVALSELGSFASMRWRHVGWTRMVLGMFAPLGALALLLAAASLAAVLGTLVAQRVREIGVRRALGAPSGSVIRSVLGASVRWGGIGAAVGVVLTFLLVAPLGQTLYGEAQLGPIVVLAALAAMALALALAAAAPLRRALKIEPTEALREE
ncbi:MAG TPA: ABC transporter permease [Xanthomonadaceae bacterium]|nr:ABC transporter permease [Xanthomonadaceae bacterium]